MANNQGTEGWQNGSHGRVTPWQTPGHEFKPQYNNKKTQVIVEMKPSPFSECFLLYPAEKLRREYRMLWKHFHTQTCTLFIRFPSILHEQENAGDIS
jgi:hypothetical protein